MTKLIAGDGKISYTLTEDEMAHIITMNSTLLLVIGQSRGCNEAIFKTAKDMTLKEMRTEKLIENLVKPYAEVFSKK